MQSKRHYDRKHQPGFLKEGDWAYLRLHHGYSLPSLELIGKKYSQQYVGPFLVTKRIGRLAYQLEIPLDWPIHNVFSMVMLEPAPVPGSDPYNRSPLTHPDSIYVEGDTDVSKSFELERILNKRVIPRGRGRTMTT